jgi:hypothetical protein
MTFEDAPRVPECCAKEENLERFETTNPFAYIKRCKV